MSDISLMDLNVAFSCVEALRARSILPLISSLASPVAVKEEPNYLKDSTSFREHYPE